ncbi:MAG: SPFH domain-containing protein [Luteolibacter sp.]|uniref:SPFH domain-containing protein n=1 Tax=Luteolibacter sp. TaxID=1962973 RepID=UPI003265FD36
MQTLPFGPPCYLSGIFETLSPYSLWLWPLGALVVVLLFWRKLLQALFGVVIIPEDRIGLVTKKFVIFGKHKELPSGRIIALNGEAGFQSQTLAPGLYFWKWIWQYEITLQPLAVIPDGLIGLIMSKDGGELQAGAVLARRVDCQMFQDAEMFLRSGGQKGRQAAFLTPGTYRINTFLFEVTLAKMTQIKENMVGIVTTLDGAPLPEGQIAGRVTEGHSNFQNADAFLSAGGCRGLQPQVILAGSYFLNTWFVHIEEIPMTEISIGSVGVVISYYGDDGVDVSGLDFKHGNIVAKGHKGVWAEPLGPGKYPLNTYILRIEHVPTTNLVLNWANARSEAHQLDKHLSTITVRSKDGFPFNLDVSQIIHIPMIEASKVIARFGNMNNLVSQVLEPTIGNYFRNSAQDSDVIAFLSTRKERQASARNHINAVLDQYNVNGVDTLIGDIAPPDSLMKTLTDRKIAEEQKVTYDTQRMAQETRQNLEKQTAIADIQKQIVQADQGVQIAERVADAAVKKAGGDAASVKLNAAAEAERVKVTADAEARRIALTGNAEAEKILAIGKANAESYQLQVNAMGGDNFTRTKIAEIIGKDKVKVMPDILITGGGNDSNGALSGLLGMKLMEELGGKTIPATVPKAQTSAPAADPLS